MSSEILVVISSETGRTRTLAEAFCAGARDAGASVESIDAANAQPAQLEAAAGLVIGSAVHMAGVASSMRAFFERTAPLWLSGAAAGKLGAGFVCAGLGGRGGGELALVEIHAFLAEQGCLSVPMRRGVPGFAEAGSHWGPIARNTDAPAISALMSHGRGFAEALQRWQRGAGD